MDSISDDVFYMILPSNSNADPKNKPSNFTVQFPKMVNLEKKMECAISEIILPKPAFNLADSYFHLVWSFRSYPEESNFTDWNFNEKKIFSLRVPANWFIGSDVHNYKSKDYLLKKIVDLYNLHGIISKESLIYHFKSTGYLSSVTNSNEIYFYEPEINLAHSSRMYWSKGYFGLKSSNKWNDHFVLYWKWDEQLFKMLGFLEEDNLNTVNKFYIDNIGLRRLGDKEGDYFLLDTYNISLRNLAGLKANYEISKYRNATDINTDKKDLDIKNDINIFVTCDLLHSSLVNNEKLNYLAHVASFNESNTFIKFDPLLFMPLSVNQFNSVNIKVLDKYFNEINLTKGEAVVSLIFRMINYT